MAPKRLVVIGDATAAGLGIPPGFSFMDILTKELKKRGVEAENWSNPGATAVGCLRQLPMIRRKLVESVEKSEHCYVLVMLGVNDRMLNIPHHDLEKALDEMIHVIIHTHATPVIYESIPDGIEHHLHKHWEQDKFRHCPMIVCPNEIRGSICRPHKEQGGYVTSRYLPEGHMPTMVNQNLMQFDMVNYNARAHAIIARHVLKKLTSIMHLPKSKKEEDEDEDEESSSSSSSDSDSDGGGGGDCVVA